MRSWKDLSGIVHSSVRKVASPWRCSQPATVRSSGHEKRGTLPWWSSHEVSCHYSWGINKDNAAWSHRRCAGWSVGPHKGENSWLPVWIWNLSFMTKSWFQQKWQTYSHCVVVVLLHRGKHLTKWFFICHPLLGWVLICHHQSVIVFSKSNHTVIISRLIPHVIFTVHPSSPLSVNFTGLRISHCIRQSVSPPLLKTPTAFSKFASSSNSFFHWWVGAL